MFAILFVVTVAIPAAVAATAAASPSAAVDHIYQTAKIFGMSTPTRYEYVWMRAPCIKQILPETCSFPALASSFKLPYPALTQRLANNGASPTRPTAPAPALGGNRRIEQSLQSLINQWLPVGLAMGAWDLCYQ